VGVPSDVVEVKLHRRRFSHTRLVGADLREIVTPPDRAVRLSATPGGRAS
jgi:hypothetical protein